MPNFEACICCGGQDRLPASLYPAMLPSGCSGCKKIVCGFCVSYADIDKGERLCFSCTTEEKVPSLPDRTVTGGCCLRRHQKAQREKKRNEAKQHKRDKSPKRDSKRVVIVATDDDGLFYVRSKDLLSSEDEAILSAAMTDPTLAVKLFQDESDWEALDEVGDHGVARVVTLETRE